jgi:hypothetical protein
VFVRRSYRKLVLGEIKENRIGSLDLHGKLRFSILWTPNGDSIRLKLSSHGETVEYAFTSYRDITPARAVP